MYCLYRWNEVKYPDGLNCQRRWTDTSWYLGWKGPKAEQVTEALDLFNFNAYEKQGRVDYILGA
ncbi:hypothetical protein [Candidatus Coxiella mudrowiae]|uniref:hypothetical protein n=1 Tax=Candidatus Coxiella mudrowiae TaxID=2054173 RepID=UPI001F4569D3|nr:hypothetical protein [Candidatus Coxiella mudrowiae]